MNMDTNFEWKSISNSSQPHKFFDRHLDNDLEKLTLDLVDRYKKIQAAEIFGVSPLSENESWKTSNSVSTMKWREYNVFQFHIDGVRKLYDAISSMVREACEYYNIDFESQQFMMQGWFNINEAHNGKLDWHDHGPEGAPNFHGYYSVSAEPSSTHYIVFDKEIENINKNNRAILSEMGHPHAMGDWEWSGPRITVAYDVLPLKDLQQRSGMTQEQHWIPLN
jgi:hypothetical protein